MKPDPILSYYYFITVNIVRLVSAFGSVHPFLRNAMDPTLIILWAFTWAAIGLIVLRLLARKLKGLQFVLGDYFSIGAILCALVRLALVTVILIWGTNNMTTTFRETHHFTTKEIHRREIASQFVLIN